MMDCDEARMQVSALHDGEPITSEVADHIRSCEDCQELLRDYAGMGADIRLLASELENRTGSVETRLLSPPGRRTSLGGILAAQVRVPRFVVALGIAMIAGLTAGLVLLEAQGKNQDLWFRCELDWPQAEFKGPIHPTNRPQVGMGFGLHAKSEGPIPFFIPAIDKQGGTIAGLMEFQRSRHDQVNFAIRVKHFEAGDNKLGLIEQAPFPVQARELGEVLASVPEQHYRYEPRTSLKIPVEGGGDLIFKGEAGTRFSGFSWQQFPLQPVSGQIVLDGPAVVPESALLVEPHGFAKVSGPNGCAYIYIPGKGLLILSLHHFPEAHEAAVDHGHALFELGKQWYYLFSEMPIIGGARPKTIWIYLAKNYEPSRFGLTWDRKAPFVGSAESVMEVLNQLKK